MTTERMIMLRHAITAVNFEVVEAMAAWSPLVSYHEAYAVILEELDEFWDEVKQKSEKQNLDRMRTELIQIAAMAVRAIVDLGLR
jgi:hypothetical protein